MPLRSLLRWVLPLTLGMAVSSNPALPNPGPIAEFLCEPSEQMRAKLTQQFRAHRAWQGLRSPDQIMELWEDDRGDWTFVIAYASGKICIVAMGTRLTGFPDFGQG
ncbi:MAG: hypothetical protein AAFQ66_11450 [Pseudomonadota bacterium]